jgi:putative sigma-54 modulation protein
MQISTTARHCELEPEVRTFAEQRLGKLERFARDIMEVHLTVTAEKFRHAAEITLKLRHQEMMSREVSNDARAAIDLAAGRLEIQLRKLKERRVGRKRGTRPREVNGGTPAAEAQDEFEGGLAEGPTPED